MKNLKKIQLLKTIFIPIIFTTVYIISLYIFIKSKILLFLYKEKINLIKSLNILNLKFNEYIINYNNKYHILYILDHVKLKDIMLNLDNIFLEKKINHACILDIKNDTYILDITKYLNYFKYQLINCDNNNNNKIKWHHILYYIELNNNNFNNDYDNLYVYININGNDVNIDNDIKYRIKDILNKTFKL